MWGVQRTTETGSLVLRPGPHPGSPGEGGAQWVQSQVQLACFLAASPPSLFRLLVTAALSLQCFNCYNNILI